MSKDELGQAASTGDLPGLQVAMKIPGQRYDGMKAKWAMVFAAEGGHLQVVRKLLEWGTPAESYDDQRRSALHAASQKGATEVVKLLISRRADIGAGDYEGRKALDMAVSQKHLPVCKVLLKAGAQLKEGQSCKGLAAIVNEVQLEKVLDELKAFATDTDFSSEIVEADSVVWQAQKEQMRLIELREKQKAGHMIIGLEQQLEFESEVYEKMKKGEEETAKGLADLRVNLQTVESAHALMKQQLETAEIAAKEAAEAESEGNVEYEAMLAEAKRVLSEKDQIERDIAEKEKGRDAALALTSELQEQANSMKLRNRDVSEELKAKSAQLRGFERDKEAAAALTAKAHLLLGVPK